VAVDMGETVLSVRDYPLTFLVIEACSAVDHIGQKLAIIEYPYLWGRSLPLLKDEKESSRTHAEISYDSDEKKFYITDLKSTNGGSLNGKQIRPDQPHEIQPGAEIGLGSVVVLRFGG